MNQPINIILDYQFTYLNMQPCLSKVVINIKVTPILDVNWEINAISCQTTKEMAVMWKD